jgi:hypothetical protein
MQLAAPGHMRGRVMANMRTVTGGIGPLAQAQSGFLASVIGGPLAIAVAGAALALSATVVGRTSPELWDSTIRELVDEDVDGRPQADPQPVA